MYSLPRMFRTQQFRSACEDELWMGNDQRWLAGGVAGKLLRDHDGSSAARTGARERGFALGKDKLTRACMRRRSDSGDLDRRRVGRAFG